MITAPRPLEAAVKERDEKLRRLQATIGRLRDDFGYNLKLVEEQMWNWRVEEAWMSGRPP